MTNFPGLHPVSTNGKTTWCGPAAIAALTGFSVDGVCCAVRAHRLEHPPLRRVRRDTIRTMWATEVVSVVKRLGFDAQLQQPSAKALLTPLGAWWPQIAPLPPTLILVQGHFIAAEGQHYVDSFAHKPTSLALCRHAQRLVLFTWTIERTKA